MHRKSDIQHLSTPSNARRQEVLRHAAASHVALSGLLERPLSFPSASTAISTLEQQLMGPGKTHELLRGVSSEKRSEHDRRSDLSLYSRQLLAPRTAPLTDEALHVSLLCSELRALEEDVLGRFYLERQRQLDEMRLRASDLEQELAAGTRACRRAKEELAQAQAGHLSVHAQNICDIGIEAVGSRPTRPPSDSAQPTHSHRLTTRLISYS